jgi:hypothetical protein
MGVKELLDIVADRDFKQISPQRFPIDYTRALARAKWFASEPIPYDALQYQLQVSRVRQNITEKLTDACENTLFVCSDSDDCEGADDDDSGWIRLNASLVSTTPSHMLRRFERAFVRCRICRCTVAAPSVIKRDDHKNFCRCFSNVLCGDPQCEAELGKLHECASLLKKAYTITRLVFEEVGEARIGPFVVLFDAAADTTHKVVPITTALSLGHLVCTDLTCRVLKHADGVEITDFMKSHSSSLLYAAVHTYTANRVDRVCRVCERSNQKRATMRRGDK